MTTYTGPAVLFGSGLTLLAFAASAPSDGAFVAAWIIGVVVAGLGALGGLSVAAARRRTAATLRVLDRLGPLTDRTVARLAERQTR